MIISYFSQTHGRKIKVNIPESVTMIDDIAFTNKDYCEIDVDKNNNHYSSRDGVLFNKDITKLVCYPPGLTSEKYEIPGSVTSINHVAFYNNDYLKELTIPNSVDLKYGVTLNENIILRVEQGSSAEQYAIENELQYIYIE